MEKTRKVTARISEEEFNALMMLKGHNLSEKVRRAIRKTAKKKNKAR